MNHTARLPVLFVAFSWALPMTVLRAEGPPKDADPRNGYRELGRLRVGLALKAREEEHDSLKAALLYLQAAQAFQRGSDNEYHKALAAGVLAAQPLRATWLHRFGAAAMTFLPGNRQILTCGVEGDTHIWDAATGREVRSFLAKDADKPGIRIEGAVFSRDRSRMLVWGSNIVWLWDLAGGKLIRRWADGPSSRSRAMFLHNDKRVLIWGSEPTRLWDIEANKVRATFDKGKAYWEAFFNREETRLVTQAERNVYLWDMGKGKLLHTFTTNEDRKSTLRATGSPDGKYFAVFSFTADDPARLYDFGTGRLRKSIPGQRPQQPYGSVRGAAFSPDGDRLAVWTDDGRARLWNVADGSLLDTFAADHRGIRFSPDGRHVISLGETVLVDGRPLGRDSSANGVVFLDNTRVLLLSDKAELWNIPQPHKLLRAFTSPRLVDAVFNSDESLLLMRSRNGAVRLWETWRWDGSRWTGEQLQTRERSFRHTAAVATAVLSRDEKRLLTCDVEGKAHLWDTATGKQMQTYTHGKDSGGALFSPDESRILTWGGQTAKLWDAQSAKVVQSLKNPADLRGCLFAADGKHLLSWDVDYAARWWDLDRGQPLHQFEHNRDLFGARLDGKGMYALTWSLDGTARKWDLSSGQLVWSLKHQRPVFGATFAAGETRVWTWAGDGFHEWDNKTGKALRHLPVKGGLAAAVLDHDGKHFLMRDAKDLIQYWDIAAAKSLATFHPDLSAHGGYKRVTAGVLSPDQTRALTWTSRESINLWALPSGLKLKTFDHDGEVRGAAFTGAGARVLSWDAGGNVCLWDASAPQPLSPDDQLLEVEVRSGLRLDEGGKMQELSIKERQERHKKLQAILTRQRGK